MANASIQKADSAGGAIERWKSGDSSGRAEVVYVLQALLTSMQQVLHDDGETFIGVSKFRDQILADERAVKSLFDELQAKEKSLRNRLAQQRREIAVRARRLAALRNIPFPPIWVAAEIQNLISSGRTMEQQLAELQRDGMHLRAQLQTASSLAAATRAFSGQLNVMEEALQNLLNSLAIMQGGMKQIVDSLESSQDNTTAVVVQAYIATLKAQASNLITYLSSAPQQRASAG